MVGKNHQSVGKGHTKLNGLVARGPLVAHPWPKQCQTGV